MSLVRSITGSPAVLFSLSIIGACALRIRSTSSSTSSRSSSLCSSLIGDQKVRDYWAAKDGEHKSYEEVMGAEALGWVKSVNENTIEMLGDPEESPLYQKILDILDSTDKIPYVTKIGNQYYNFWKDSQNPRGILRRTTLSSYKSSSPVWETVLDVDKLGKDENESWVYVGSTVYYPPDGSTPTRTLLSLSPGGSDATTIREFDLLSKKFVDEKDAGFILPCSKSRVSWINKDLLLLGTDFTNDGEALTNSGYPMDVRLWKRGESHVLAIKLFEGEKEDVAVSGYVSKHQDTILEWRSRALTFYTSKIYVRKLSDPMSWKTENVESKYFESNWNSLEIPSDATGLKARLCCF